jgi:hypothetical protein
MTQLIIQMLLYVAGNKEGKVRKYPIVYSNDGTDGSTYSTSVYSNDC